MATLKQKKVVRDLSENIGKPLGQAMRDAGYSVSTSKTPKRLTTRIGWQGLMDQYLPEELLLKVHRGLLNHKEWRARDAGLDKGYRLRSRYAPPRIAREPDPLEDLSDEELDRELERLKGELERQKSRWRGCRRRENQDTDV